jgi:DNA-directed RNA polymerase subunit RPC12/RpoP
MKIIKCGICGHEIKSDKDIVYVVDSSVYFNLHFKNDEITYKRQAIKYWENGSYLCKKCHNELPLQTGSEVKDYLKKIKGRK